MRLRTKVLSFSLAIVITAILFLSLPVYWYLRGALEDELDKRLLSVGEIISKNINMDLLGTLSQEPSLNHVRQMIEDNLSKFISKQIGGVAIYRSDGKELVVVDGNEYGVEQIPQLWISVIENKGEKEFVSELYKLSNGQFFKIATIPLTVKQDINGFLIVWGGADFLSEMKQITGIVFWVIIMTVGIAIGLAIVFSTSLLSPVRNLSEYTRSIKKNINTDTVLLKRKDELGELSLSLVEMHTEIKQNEETMKQLLSGIAHEIKNPLGGLEIYSGLLQEELLKVKNKSSSEESMAYLEKMSKEIQHLKQAVFEYLDYAKPIKSKLKSVRVESLVEDVFRILLPELTQKKISYSLSGVGKVLADESKLRRVFLNLLKNSLYAVDEMGTIDVMIEQQNRMVNISVKDNGVGIRDEDISKIFEPYFTTHKKGFGLGLTIVKNIVDELDGTIIVKSKEGKGTTFYIKLPKDEKE